MGRQIGSIPASEMHTSMGIHPDQVSGGDASGYGGTPSDAANNAPMDTGSIGGPGDPKPKPKPPHTPGEGGVGGAPVKTGHQKNSGYMPYGDNEAPQSQSEESAAKAAALHAREHQFEAQLGNIPDSTMTPTEIAHRTTDSTANAGAARQLATENATRSEPALAPRATP